MRSLHRNLAVCVSLFALYLALTGTLIQLTDLRTLLTHASAYDPNMMAIREGLDGTADFQVIGNADFTAPALRDDLDLAAAIRHVMGTARPILGDVPVQYVELRMINGTPTGQVRSDNRLLRIDATSGSLLQEGTPPSAAGGTFVPSLRNTFKGLHRMTAIGNWTLWINILVGVSLCILLVTGLRMYAKLSAARRTIGRSQWFWSAGGSWRSIHRAVAVVSAILLLIVAISGSWLAVESLGRAIMGKWEREALAKGQIVIDGNHPVKDDQLDAMLKTTLAAYRCCGSSDAIRALRLRNYGGMLQGVIVTGAGEAHQLVFNAETGRAASETEPGYPPQHFPFGWQAHQIAKQIHRGDYFGMPGRWMDLIAGGALIYLSVSGGWMYLEMWKRRRKAGNDRLLWK